MAVAQVLRESDPRLADRVRGCGWYLDITRWIDHGRNTVNAASWCQRPRLCDGCAHARGIKFARAYAEKAALVLDQANQLVPWMVTFTVKNGPDLAERVCHLLQSYRRGMQEAKNHFKGRRCWSPFAAAAGSLYSLEIKRGSGARLWHPHLHCLWLVPRGCWAAVLGNVRGERAYYLEPMAHRALCQAWEGITGDSKVVNARVLESGVSRLEGPQIDGAKLFGDLLEVFKYFTKPGGLSPAEVVEANRVVDGKQLVRASGMLRGVKVPEGCDDGALDGPFWRAWYEWAGGMYRQVSCRAGHVARSVELQGCDNEPSA